MLEYEDNDLMSLMKTGVNDNTERFEKLDKNGVIETYGKLKGLETMSHILDATRESLTRLLVVNGVDVTKDESELRKEWQSIDEDCSSDCSK
tara:strand:+ start:1274 stop:1549 length:276 start_codon:yes stop_codon:yes gene_type:complete